MRKRTSRCVRIAFIRRRTRTYAKGGVIVWKLKTYPTYTLTEGLGQPQFTFNGNDVKLGESFRAVTSDWCKHDIFALPSYERIS